MAYASGKSLTLTRYLSAGDAILYADSDLWVWTWRIFFQNDSQIEWISYTSRTTSWVTLPNGNPEYKYEWLTRWLSQTADPATAWVGYSWLATSIGKLVQMHDQMIDKNIATQSRQEALTFATEAARDTALWGNGVCTFNYTDVKCTDTGLFYNYNTSTGQWEVQWTGTATPNASTTVAGSVEIATIAESKAWTDTWGTWAKVSVLPSDIAANTQSGTFVYWHSTDVSDTYTASLTPAITAYTTWMLIRIKFDTANTWACSINLNTLGAKSIKLIDWTDPLDWDIAAWITYEFIYDGTNFVLQQTPVRATAAEAVTWTNTLKYITPKQAKDNYAYQVIASDVLMASSDTQVSTTSTTYVKVKEVQINKSWVYRVSFDMQPWNPGWSWAWGQIYVNGVATWPEQTNGWAYATFTSDFSVNIWDLVQLYIHGNVTGVDARNFRIKWSITTTLPTVII